MWRREVSTLLDAAAAASHGGGSSRGKRKTCNGLRTPARRLSSASINPMLARDVPEEVVRCHM